MYNPINRLLTATSDRNTYQAGRPHPVLASLEIVAMVSFVPGMLIFLHAFVLSAASLFACFEVNNGNHNLAVVIFLLFNTSPGLLGLLVSTAGNDMILKGLATFVIYGGLGVWGVLAVVKQKSVTNSA